MYSITSITVVARNLGQILDTLLKLSLTIKAIEHSSSLKLTSKLNLTHPCNGLYQD